MFLFKLKIYNAKSFAIVFLDFSFSFSTLFWDELTGKDFLLMLHGRIMLDGRIIILHAYALCYLGQVWPVSDEFRWTRWKNICVENVQLIWNFEYESKTFFRESSNMTEVSVGVWKQNISFVLEKIVMTQ